MWLRPLLLFLPSVVWAINYRCQNDQVLVVQSFGNDTIRMHCQKLDLCGYQKLRCDYDEHQPQCGGMMNFVAHVHQSSATSPVEHTCCQLFNPRPPHMVTTHAGNDCFIYELPDGSSVARPKEETPSSDTPLTVLKSVNDIPEHIDNVSGYRLRLFHLKNKSPPTLLVKGIERRLDGYRVTICRPRCTSIAAAGQERASSLSGTGDDGAEWKVISWSQWTSSSWSAWANSVGAGGERTRTRTAETGNSPSTSSSEASRAHGSINVDVDANGNNNNQWEKQGGGGGGFNRPTVNGEPAGHINITIHTAGEGKTAGQQNGQSPNINVSANAQNHVHIDGSGKLKHGEGSEEEGLLHGKRGKGSGEEGSQPRGGLSSGEAADKSGKMIGKRPNGGGDGNELGDGDADGRGKAKNGSGKDKGKNGGKGDGSDQPNGNQIETDGGDSSGNKKGSSAGGDNNGPSDGEGKSKGDGGSKGEGDLGDGRSKRPNGEEGDAANGGKGDGSTGGANKGNKAGGNGGSGEEKDLLNGKNLAGNGGGNGGPKDGSDGGKSNGGANKPAGKDGDNLHASGKNGPDGIDAGNSEGDGKDGKSGKNIEESDGKPGKDGKNIEESDGKSGKNGKGSTSGSEGNKGKDGDEIRASGKDGGDGTDATGKGDKNGGLVPDEKEGEATWTEGGPDAEAEFVTPPVEQKRQPNIENGGNGKAVITELRAGAGPDGVDAGEKKGEDGGEAGEKRGPSGKTEEEAAAERKEQGEGEKDGQLEGSGGGVTGGDQGPTPSAPVKTRGERIQTEQHAQMPTKENPDGVEVPKDVAADAGAAPASSASSGTSSGESNSQGSNSQGGSSGESTANDTPQSSSGGSSSGTAQSDTPSSGGAATAADSGSMIAAMNNMNCFPADSLVATVAGPKRMDQLQVGDFILVPSAGNVLKYERVEMFYHREETTRAQFVVLMTRMGKRMALTPLHLLPFGKCEEISRAMNSSEGISELLGASRFAQHARVGDCVLSIDGEGELVADRITRIGRQYSEGIYSPMTVEGSLLVDGVLASCFAQLESHSVHKTVFDFLMYFRNFFGYGDHVHHEVQGIPSFISYVHDLSHYVLPFAKY